MSCTTPLWILPVSGAYATLVMVLDEINADQHVESNKKTTLNVRLRAEFLSQACHDAQGTTLTPGRGYVEEFDVGIFTSFVHESH